MGMTRRGLLAACPVLLAPHLWTPRCEPRLVGVHRFLKVGELLPGREHSGVRPLQLEALDGAVDSSPRVPPERFYIRTFAPATPPSWPIRVTGLVHDPGEIDPATLVAEAQEQGPVLLECSGNRRLTSFGLISSNTWRGVPLKPLLQGLGLTSEARGLQVIGYGGRSDPQDKGWVFNLDDLDDAFLATHLGDQPLGPDHGAPVRLIVPGWYGCVAIKWVKELQLVGADAAPTPHMWAYSSRIFQDAVPQALAWRAPQQATAVATRVEQWTDDRDTWRVIHGLVWGAEDPGLEIRTRSQVNEWEPIEQPALGSAARTWRLWSHRWSPRGRGRRQIDLRLRAEVPQAYLDDFTYRRIVVI